MNKTLDFPFQLKAINADGSFSGYGSVFGVKDAYDEIVMQGAFAESLAAHQARNTLPAMLWQHRSAEPLGAYLAMKEDAIGLHVDGQINLKTVRGAEAHELLNMKPRPAINGLSIGFITREDSYDRVTGITTLKRVDLWEVSLVTFPANDAARVQSVKTIEGLDDLKSAEKYLRDAGLSRRQAVAFIARVKGLDQSDSDEDVTKRITEMLSLRLTRFTS